MYHYTLFYEWKSPIRHQATSKTGDCRWPHQSSLGFFFAGGGRGMYGKQSHFTLSVLREISCWQSCLCLTSWQPTLQGAWYLAWWFASIEISMVIHDLECPYWDQGCISLCSLGGIFIYIDVRKIFLNCFMKLTPSVIKLELNTYIFMAPLGNVNSNI